MKVRVSDTIKVTAGKDRGKTGKITKVFPKLGSVLVEGINKVKKHVKPQGEGKPGGIIEAERPLPLAAIALICPSCKQPTRVGYRQANGERKERFCRKCDSSIK